jgi:hypothetical protein
LLLFSGKEASSLLKEGSKELFDDMHAVLAPPVPTKLPEPVFDFVA